MQFVILEGEPLEKEIFLRHELHRDGFQMIDEVRVVRHFEIMCKFVAGEYEIEVHDRVQNRHRWRCDVQIGLHLVGKHLLEVPQIEK